MTIKSNFWTQRCRYDIQHPEVMTRTQKQFCADIARDDIALLMGNKTGYLVGLTARVRQLNASSVDKNLKVT